MKLHLITALLDTKGWHIKVSEPIEAKETAKMVIAGRLRIRVSELGNIKTRFIETPGSYRYYALCLVEEVDDTRIRIKDFISRRVIADMAQMKSIYDHVS